MTRKILEAFFALLLLIILVNVAIVALQPYLPLLGISLAVIIIIALGVLAFRLLFKRKGIY